MERRVTWATSFGPGTHDTSNQGPKGVDHVHPGALGDYLQRQMGYQKIRCNPQMQNILLDRTQHPQHQHQGPRGVGHVPPGALGDHLQGQMGYQKIHCNSQMQNILFDRTQHPQHQGPRGVGQCNTPQLDDY